jgi:hypothetical protein
MKDFTIRMVLTIVLTFLPIMPLLIIEPVHEGTDTNVYSFWAELYIRILFYAIGFMWYFTAKKIVDKFLGDNEII